MRSTTEIEMMVNERWLILSLPLAVLLLVVQWESATILVVFSKLAGGWCRDPANRSGVYV